MSLAECLEQAASELPVEAEAIRPANGDPAALFGALESESAARVLGWLLVNCPDEAEELAEAWLQEPDGPATLMAVSSDSLSKPGRKVLRRLIHRAKSRGIDMGTSGPDTRAKVSRLPKVDTPLDQAYVAALDPRGARLVYLVESPARGGARVFEALLDASQGFADFQVYQAGRSAVRAFIKDIKNRPRYGAVLAEPSEVRALFARRLASHPADRPLPRAFSEWRGRLIGGDEVGATPGEAVRATLSQTKGETAPVSVLTERIARGEIGPWPPSDHARFDEAIGKVRAAVEEGDPDDLDARLRIALDDVAGLLFDAPECEILAERFEESAYVYWRKEEVDVARACLQVASELRTEEAASHAVIRALMEQIMGALLAELRGAASPSDAAAEEA